MSIHKNAYHVLCRSCHKPNTRTVATINGPVRCRECHSLSASIYRQNRRSGESRLR